MSKPLSSDVSTVRLYLLRALYLLIFVGQASIQLPILANRGATLSFWQGVGSSMLLALAVVSTIGIRYPLQMLPLLFFEFGWKLVWIIAVFVPRWSAGAIDAATAESAREIMFGAIVPVIIPWRYVIAHYITKPGDRWGAAREVPDASA